LETDLVFLGYSSSPSSASLFHLQKPKASNKQSTEVKTRGEKTRKTTKLITQQREEALQRQKQKTAVAGNPRETMIACKDNTRKPRETRQRLAREREIETETQRDGDGEREREREERNATTHKWSESLAKLAWQDRTDHICPSPSLNAPDLPRTL
jgi:hypothetical protein